MIFEENSSQSISESYNHEEVSKMFPKPIQVLRMAASDGIIPKDSMNLIDKDEAKARLKDYVVNKLCNVLVSDS